MHTIKVLLENSSSNQNFMLELLKSPAVVAIVALLGVIVGGFINNKINLNTLKAKRNEMKINEIKESLNVFYYPILLLIRKNRQLYDIFTYDKAEDFSTLVDLLESKEFTNNDKKILEAIIDTDKKINNLIIDEKGKIKDKNIAEILAKASVHFDVIIMAHEGKISCEADRFKNYVYPKKLGEIVEKEIERLVNELKGLEK